MRYLGLISQPCNQDFFLLNYQILPAFRRGARNPREKSALGAIPGSGNYCGHYLRQGANLDSRSAISRRKSLSFFALPMAERTVV